MSVKKQIVKGILILLILILALTKNCFAETALEQYVKAPDDAFQYKLVKTAYTFLYTTYVFEITSQQWHPDEVEPGTWKHWLRIVEPRLLGKYTLYIPFFSLVKSDKALLYLLRGDAEHEDAPSGATFEEAKLALTTRSIVAELHGIPIGPIRFNDENIDSASCSFLKEFLQDEYQDKCTVPRSEDSLQARSFDLALSTGDFTWALMAPMTKAVIRGMDVIQDFLQQRYLGRQAVREFVLTGHSKRGHIAWLAAALDDRIAAVAPVSYDLLNISEQIALQEASWPARSPQQDANEEFDLYARYKTDTGSRLIDDVDPYAYRDRLGIPALILVGTGDPYSCSDAANLYLDNMTGATRILYVPNTGHDIRELPQVGNAIANFYRHLIGSRPLPEFAWAGLQEGLFTITPADQKPAAVKLWSAVNPLDRDFRQTDNLTAWTSTDIAADLDGTYEGTVPLPQNGFKAFYIELLFQNSGKEASFSLTTPLTILEP